MKNKLPLTFLLVFLLLLMVSLVSYRIYLFVYEGDYQSLNAENGTRGNGDRDSVIQ